MPMPTIIPLVPVDLDKRRYLRLGHRAVYEAELEFFKLWGKKVGFLTVLSTPGEITLNDLSIMVWKGLSHEDPALTLAMVQEMLPLDRQAEIYGLLIDAWNLACGRPITGTNGTAPEETPDPLALISPGPSSGLVVVSNWG